MFVCPECGASQPVPGSCTADGWALVPIGEDVLLGQMIGPYRVARLLGVGGMGRVYKGVHPQIGSRVAIKVLSRECSDRRDLVERFFSEARAVNLIRHESIVNVLDLASLPDGRPYIIMEYLDGAPLASAIEHVPRTGPLPLGSVVRLAVEALDALGAAHAKGIVHRDLKPDNLFVTPQGRPKILDFGIAKLLPELGGSYTQTGSLLGTPHYMAPEQAAGKPVDYRADLYAMGVILFECVTGTKPFHGDSLFDLLRKHVDAPPPPPSTIRPDMPPALEQIILVALAKAPEARWQSAQAMSAALQQAVQTLPPEQWTPLPGGSASGTMRVPSGFGSQPGRWSSPHTEPIAAQPTTTVAGQASAPMAKKSRGALWIALAILVAGGGVTTAVVAGKHGDKPAEKPPAESTDKPVAVKPQTPTTQTPTTQTPTTQPPTTQPPTTQTPTIQRVPPGGWLTYRALTKPNWDPAHVDVDEFLRWAMTTAKQAIPDAEMFRIDANNVYPDGHADLTLSSSGYVSIRFLSPSRSVRDPSVPVGAEPNWHCMFQIIGMVQTGPIIVPMDGSSCEGERAQPVPRCSTRAAWQLMIDRKAPAGNAVAQLGYWASDKTEAAQWFGSVGNAFSERFADSCK